MDIEPTVKGMEKYSDTDGYYEHIPCTCGDTCLLTICRGECGCAACLAAYYDSLEWS